MNWVASYPPFGEGNVKKKYEKGLEYYAEIKGKLSEQVPDCNFQVCGIASISKEMVFN